jgi:hypothetical protein
VSLVTQNGFHFEIRDIVVEPYNELPVPLDSHVIVPVSGSSSIGETGQEVLPGVEEFDPRLEVGPIREIPGLEIGIEPAPDPFLLRRSAITRINEDEISGEIEMRPEKNPFRNIRVPTMRMVDKPPTVKFVSRRLTKKSPSSGPPNEAKMRLSRLYEPLKPREMDTGGSSDLGMSLPAHTCVASAFHPEGKAMRFRFEFRKKFEEFSGTDLVLSDFVSPQDPDTSFLVEAIVPIPERPIPSDLKYRVQTVDDEGVTSPWLVIEEPRVKLHWVRWQEYDYYR